SLAVIRVSQSLVCILFIFMYILNLSPKAGILFLGLFSVGSLYYRMNQRTFEKKIEIVLQKEATLFEKFNQLIDGFKELKMNHEKSKDIFENYLRPADIEATNSRIDMGETRAKYEAIVFIFLFYLSLGCISFLLPSTVPLETKFKIVAAVAFLWGPISALSIYTPEIFKAKASLDRLAELENKIKTSYEVVEFAFDPEAEQLHYFDELKLEQYSFNYDNINIKSNFSVGPINMHLKSGEIVFLVGGNGSGKSTLLKLLTGLYSPLSGKFFIDGIEVDIEDHRYLFSVVFSDCHLFDGLYGIEDINDQKVYDLLEMMFLRHKVQWVDKRFIDAGLSTGQQKRLVLVIALLEDKPVYVFDEWAAEQDPEFRKFFYEKLLPKMKTEGKTIIAATHDEHYFHVADRIIKMEDGKIVEQKN
ncbi:MAG: ATP-binding cassette domain-containing protein, partial [Desulfobacterales bacterium]|nr:ATP-binding cassette domain-containing protein [Desulfobacterales bacterium]